MADWELLYPGRFLNKLSLVVPKVIRITAVDKTMLTTVKKGKEVEEEKVVIKYKAADGEGEIPWNKTNAALTAFALDERDSDKWIGRLVTVHHDPNVAFGGEKLGGIRVCGSPEMKATKRVEIKRPRRKNPEVYTLTPTDMKGAPVAVGSAAKKAETPAPAPEASEKPAKTLPPREVTDKEVDKLFGMDEAP